MKTDMSDKIVQGLVTVGIFELKDSLKSIVKDWLDKRKENLDDEIDKWCD